MQQSKTIFAILAIAIFTTLACKKESTTPTTPTNTTTTNNTTVKETAKWIRQNYAITYKADGVTEDTRNEYSYDSEGRPTEVVGYSDGVISYKQKGYIYSGDECTYTLELYTNGSLYSTKKAKVGFKNQ